jgi:arginine decarboxylase
VEESIKEAMDFRRAMRKVDKEFGKDWWFTVWGPDKLVDDGIGRSDAWTLKAKDKWHGFGNLADRLQPAGPDQVHPDHPGAGHVGQVRARPASRRASSPSSWPSMAWWSRRRGCTAFFIMFTIGITKGRWNTLLTALQQFKDDYDRNAPMWRILPEFCAGPSALREAWG